MKTAAPANCPGSQRASEAPERPSGGRRRSFWLSLALLSVGLFFTAWLAHFANAEVDAAKRQEFDFSCDQLQDKIQARLKDCETILLSGASFLDHASWVSRQEWRRFVEQQQLERRFPGIQGVGVSWFIPPRELAQHEATIRAEGFPGYQVWPAGPRESYTAIIYLEPFADRNLRAFGYDMMAEPVRRAAMERARDDNQAALTGRVKLVQETDRNNQAGTLMFVPVYHQGMPVASVAERRAALLGWVYSAYRMGDLMGGILEGRDLAGERRIHLEIFDGVRTTPQSLLHDTAPGISESQETSARLIGLRRIVAAGRPWTMRFTTTEAEANTGIDHSVWLVLLGGTSISLLLAGLQFSLLTTRVRAGQLADQLTAEIKASEEKFRAIANYTAGWESWFDLNGSLRWVNPGVERITGYSPEEVMALPDLSAAIVAPEDRDRFNALAQGGVPDGKADGIEFRCIRKNGGRFWLSMSWHPILGADGRALGIRASGRDITELKRVETDLRQAKLVLEQANTSIMIADHHGIIEYTNDEFTKVTGYTKAEAVGRNPRFLQSGQTSPATYVEMWRNLLAGGSWQGEFQNWRKDGTTIWESTVISPLRDHFGQVTHYVAIKQDVSERKRLQLALQESLSNFRTFFETITDMVFVGSPEGKLIATNRAVPDSLGYTPDELVGMDVLEIHPADQQKEAAAIFAAMIRGERSSCPLPLARKDGTLVPADTRVWHGQWNGSRCIFGISKNLSAEQEARQRFERLFRHNPALMALTAMPEGVFADVNYSFLRVLGYELHEVIGKSPAELSLFIDPQCQARAAGELVRDGRIANIELRLRRRDGGLLHGLFSGEVIWSQGKQYFLTVMIDVTETKRMEVALKESNERLSLATQAGGVGLWDYDVIKNQLVWDDQMFRLYGTTRNQFSGAYDAWQRGVHPDDRHRSDQEIQNALRGERNFNTEFRVVWPDGSVHDIRALALVQRDAAGLPLRIVGTNWEITAEKQAAKTLRWNQELLQLMATSSPLGFLVVDNRTDKILHFNQRFCVIWGIEHLADQMRRGELKNKDVIPHCLAALVDVPAFAASCVPLQDESNRIVLTDEILFTHHRTIRRFTTQIRDAEDRYYGRFYIFEDVSDLKRREAEAVAMLEKERQISEMKTRFISVTSHEFRTPMAAAVASTELLANHHDRLAPAKRNELLLRIIGSLRRMETMLDEILLLNRLDESRVEVTPSPVDLQLLLPELVDEIRMGDRDAHRFVIVASGADGMIDSDPSLLHHVFSNLLSNAVRYSPPGTTVRVRLEAGAEQVRVVVEDEGIGIPPADRVRIFEPFERGSNVGNIQGTGLGLNIVKRMTTLLGGTIAVESVETGGTRFTVVFARSTSPVSAS